MNERRSLQYGMPVRGPRGERLGRLVSCAREHFLVRRSVFSRELVAVRYSEIRSLTRGMVWLARGAEAFEPAANAAPPPHLTVLPIGPDGLESLGVEAARS